jgi:translation initiation factor 6 (eIF-6)
MITDTVFSKVYLFCHVSVVVLPYSVFEAELSETIPVIHASVAGCRIIGRMCVGKYKAI